VIGIPVLGVPELGAAMGSTLIDSMIAECQQALDKLAAQKGCDGEVLLKTGDARDLINQMATELRADLIVMGTHGRRGVSQHSSGASPRASSARHPVPC